VKRIPENYLSQTLIFLHPVATELNATTYIIRNLSIYQKPDIRHWFIGLYWLCDGSVSDMSQKWSQKHEE